MEVFNKDKNYNIYSMKRYVNKKKITIVIMAIIVTILAFSLAIYYTIDTTLRIKRSEEYMAQIIQYKEEQKRIEEERKNAKREAKIPKLTEEGKENIRKIYKSDTKRAFITFDDGPSINTNKILDILKENDIKATFFVLGNQVEIFPETTKKIYEEGHYIANHGYSHIYSNIYQAPEQVVQEFSQCNLIVANTIGVAEYNSHLFRFPGGSVRWKICKNKK